MNRRVFLKRGLLGGALLAVGGGVALGAASSRLAFVPTEALRVLDARRFAILAAIANRIVTAPGADPVAIAHAIDRSLSRAVPEAQKDISDVLMLFENALTGALLDLRFRPFTQLDGPAQDRVLDAWRTSRITLRRGAYKALKNLCVTSFYRLPTGWAVANYAGPVDVTGVNVDPDATERTAVQPAVDPEPVAPAGLVPEVTR